MDINPLRAHAALGRYYIHDIKVSGCTTNPLIVISDVIVL